MTFRKAEFTHTNRLKNYMRNIYKLVWSDEALSGLNEIIGYLEYRFSEKEIKKFAKRLDAQIEIIRNNPHTFPVSPKSKTLRRAIVAKLTIVYYRVDAETITLVTIYDSRKNNVNPAH